MMGVDSIPINSPNKNEQTILLNYETTLES